MKNRNFFIGQTSLLAGVIFLFLAAAPAFAEDAPADKTTFQVLEETPSLPPRAQGVPYLEKPQPSEGGITIVLPVTDDKNLPKELKPLARKI